MDETQLFRAHIARLLKTTATALEEEDYEAVAIYAGHAQQYFADDQDVPFRPTPHFSHWCPLRSPGHTLLLRGGEHPRIFLHDKPSYWLDNEIKRDPFWADNFSFTSSKELGAALSNLRAAWIGPEVDWLPTNVSRNPEPLRSRLDAVRRIKSDYEIACISAANSIARRGHARLQECFAAGESEFAMHLAYLRETQQTESDLPYPTIIALDDKAAVLHYQHKRRDLRNGKVLLADCGASVRGYAADVTRTWVSKDAHPLFIELWQAMQDIQQELCAAVKSGVRFYDLHYQAHKKIAQLLIYARILRKRVSVFEAVSAGLTKIFFPHGLGHLLGLQTHDVGGDSRSFTRPSMSVFADMRFTGELEVNEVITIEPGLYFIPMLLDKYRKNTKILHNNCDVLRPYGGIRIEDNIQVKEDTSINLTKLH